jgi:hypothetical protein
MAELKVELRFIGYGDGRQSVLCVIINSRQALKEGPRRIGQCVYCAGPCRGATANCETRVFDESIKR